MLIYLVSSENHFGGEIAGYGRGLLEAEHLSLLVSFMDYEKLHQILPDKVLNRNFEKEFNHAQ